MTSEDLLSEIQALVHAGSIVHDERGIERTLRGCHRELLADAHNSRMHDLFFDLGTRELRVLPWTAQGVLLSVLLRLPLGGSASGLEGQAALEECISILAQHLAIPVVCRRLHPEFFEALCAASQREP